MRNAAIVSLFAAALAVSAAAAPASAAPVHVSPNARVRAGLLLHYRHEAELPALVRLQADPASRLHGRYLSRAQWDAYFAPGNAETDAIARALGPGFALDRTHQRQGFVVVSASARDLERVFSTERRVPAALRNVVADVTDLDGLLYDMPPHVVPPAPRDATSLAPVSAPSVRRPRAEKTPKPNPDPEPTLVNGPQYVHGESGGLGPVAVAVGYDYPVQHGYAGRGRTVGNVVGADFLDSDLAAFFTEFAIVPGGTVTRVPVDGGPSGGSAAGQLEATTDVEAALGTAPDADFVEYLVPVLDELEIENAYAQALDDDVADIVNSSFGVCESQDPAAEYDFDQLALQGAALGITFVAATGDGGSTECPGPNGQDTQQGIDVPAAGYYFTALGATDLDVNASDGQYVSETASPTSGGGYSEFLPVPSWQKKIANVNPAGRNVPDLALLGGSASGYDIVINGVNLPSSGTSVASALFCGYLAEFDEISGTRGGWLDPGIYKIFKQQSYAFAFRDVTVGSNGLFQAGTGYDDVMGIGSILGWELAGTY